jgi:hypothetical protein
MSIHPCGLPALLALCLGAVASPAAAGEVYQWKDAKGVTHYSDAPPPKGRYAARDIRQRGIQRDGTAAVAAAPAKAAPDPNTNCTLARTNLQRLQAGGDIGLDANGDGKPDASMDAAERARQTRLAEANIRSFCAAAPAAPKTP